MLRQPLLHFLLGGVALFGLYWMVAPPEQEPHRIEIGAAEVDRLAAIWLAQWGREPTSAELKRLLDHRVREEILYREALALGLERDDPVIRRRLAQKLDAAIAEAVALTTPTREELEQFYEENAEAYRVEATVSFQHVFVQGDDTAARERARGLEARLGSAERDALGDRFHAGPVFAEVRAEWVRDHFGAAFQETLLTWAQENEYGAWLGPLRSMYGWHWVRRTGFSPGLLPPFEKIEQQLLSDWRRAQRVRLEEMRYRRLSEKYAVDVVEISEEGGN